MSIAAVAVDRGRIIRKLPTGRRLEGRTSFAPVPEQWFKCRLFLEQSNNVIDPVGGHVSSVNAPQVLAVAKDLDGNPLKFEGDFSIDIASNEFGRNVWRMQGEPQPLRKKRRVIGYVLFVERVIERAFEDLLNENVPDLGSPAVG